MATGVIVVRTEFAEKYPQQLEKFMQEYAESVKFVNENTEQAAELGIAPHDPLLNLRAGFTGPNDEPVLLGKQYYVGSRYVMVM